MKWIRDAIRAAREVRKLRKAGIEGELAVIDDSLVIMPEEDYAKLMERLHDIAESHRLAYDCIEDMAAGKSRCRYCLENPYCTNKRKGNVRGCQDWVLMFPETEEKDEQTAEEGAPENSAQASQDDA